MTRYSYAGSGIDDLTRTPVEIARGRTAGMTEEDAERFLDLFARAYAAELSGRDTWQVWQRFVREHDSLAMAAWVEGTAGARRERIVSR